MSELVERLLKKYPMHGNYAMKIYAMKMHGSLVNPDGPEAADRIEVLEAENRDLRVDIEIKRKRLEDAEAELARVTKLAEDQIKTLKRCASIVKRYNWHQSEKVDDIPMLANDRIAAWEAHK